MTPDEIEAARKSRGLSKRAAARKAGISEGRWRQIVAGSMRVGGVEVPVNTKASTLEAMARAVSGEPHAASATIKGYSNVELADEVRRRLLLLGEGGSNAQAKPIQKIRSGEDVRDADPDVLVVNEHVHGGGKGPVGDPAQGFGVEVGVDEHEAVAEQE